MNQPAEEPIPENVRRFIAAHINSVESLEVLLFLFAAPARESTAAEVSRSLCTSLDSATARLQELHRSKLVLAIDGADFPKYRFNTESPDAVIVAGLEKTYRQRRVSVISFIYSKPSDPLRAFLDAFKLRKDEP